MWVFPPGLHGEGEWGLEAVVSLRGERQYSAVLPLVAEPLTPGARPEFPAGHTVVRLRDEGEWAVRMAQVETVIQDLIARHGPGQGALLVTPGFTIRIDPADRASVCSQTKAAGLLLYLEDAGQPDLMPIPQEAFSGFVDAALEKACAG